MAKLTGGLAVSKKTIDPTLDALFSSSSGPIKVPPKTRYSVRPPAAPVKQRQSSDESDDEVRESAPENQSDASSEDNHSEAGSGGEESSGEEAATKTTQRNGFRSLPEESPRFSPKPARKRKRKSLADELEEAHLRRMAEEDSEDSPPAKKLKEADDEEKEAGDTSGWSTGNSSSDNDDAGDDEGQESESEEDEDGDIPMHESLVQGPDESEIERANRTVFLANVSNEAISSKSAKKTLMAHMAQILDRDAKPRLENIESIRFRSVAFSTRGQPKRAAYITKSLMDATTKSTNAYVVYSTAAAARKAVTELNGTVVLGRHLRVDGVAHPSMVDHRRCVFVGNLGFVDDESRVRGEDDNDDTGKKKKKPPADVEEGLWRAFGKEAGKVENVRVVRDPKTRVGKGFAYVQFYDANDVEAALLLDDKKFPPMLPRKLRVTRAKNPQKTATALEKRKLVPIATTSASQKAASNTVKHKPKTTPDQKSMSGRAGKLLGVAGAARQMRGTTTKARSSPSKVHAWRDKDDVPSGIKTPEEIVFEGKRAKPGDAPLFRRKAKGGAGAKRVAAWKKAKGGSKK